MNVFAEAFQKAGIDTDASRLAVAANGILARFDISPLKARQEFSNLLRSDDRLRLAIADLYLTQRAADMRGESLIGGGQDRPAYEGQMMRAPTGQSVGGDGSQRVCAAAKAVLLPSPPPKADPGSHPARAVQATPTLPLRSAPKRSVEDILADCGGGRGQSSSVAHPGYASPATPARDPAPWTPKPVSRTAIDARLKAAQRSAQVATKTVLDTYMVRGNVPIGDLAWSEAKSLARLNECEARVLRYVTDHVVNARPGALVRDVVKSEVVENAIRLAAEASNVAA